MSLPSYIINWEEMDDVVSKALDRHYYPTLSSLNYPMRVKGFSSFVHGFDDKNVFDWFLDRDIIITSITYSQSSYRDEDYWELWLDGIRPLHNMQSREIGEKIHWMDIKKIEKGTNIRFKHTNNSMTEKYVWVDIEYMELNNEYMEVIKDDEFEMCIYRFNLVDWGIDLPEVIRFDFRIDGEYATTVDLLDVDSYQTTTHELRKYVSTLSIEPENEDYSYYLSWSDTGNIVNVDISIEDKEVAK